MPLWKLAPAAAADDPRWLDHAMWSQVVVRAPTAAMARVLAGQLERDPDAPSLGNESHDFKSAFDDEKLYWVEELPDAAASRYAGENGPLGIVETAR